MAVIDSEFCMRMGAVHTVDLSHVQVEQSEIVASYNSRARDETFQAIKCLD